MPQPYQVNIVGAAIGIGLFYIIPGIVFLQGAPEREKRKIGMGLLRNGYYTIGGLTVFGIITALRKSL